MELTRTRSDATERETGRRPGKLGEEMGAELEEEQAHGLGCPKG
jgi:hypothetical protein